jgi:hypothetical protein
MVRIFFFAFLAFSFLVCPSLLVELPYSVIEEAASISVKVLSNEQKRNTGRSRTKQWSAGLVILAQE